MNDSFLFGLGDKVRDRITGQEGLVVSRAEHLFGCARYWVDPQAIKDGKPVDGRWLDEDGIELVKAGVLKQRRYRVHDVDEMPAPPLRRAAGGPDSQPSVTTGPTSR